MAGLNWSERAQNDLADIAEYIAEDSPRAARDWTSRIVLAVNRLAEFPQSGRIVAEYGDAEIREIIVGNYRVVYRAISSGVEIARVWHGARPLPAEGIG